MLDTRLGLGTSIAIKIGSRYPSPNDWRHYQNWRHGHVVEIREMGYIGHNSLWRKHNLVIDLPNVPYWGIRGDTEWISTKSGVLTLAKYVSVPNKHGVYSWETSLTDSFAPKSIKGKQKIREWLVDPEWLLQHKYISLSQWESIYDKSRPHDPIVLTNIFDLNSIIKHEDSFERISNEKDQLPGSISAGTYSIGSSLNYDTLTLFVADIAATQTGDLKGEHANEETTTSSDGVISHSTASYKFTITAASGAEHNGAAYGNGARIAMSASNGIWIDETTGSSFNNAEISKLALRGAGSYAIRIADGGDNVEGLFNRILIKGNGSNSGVYAPGNFKKFSFRNCILYDLNFGFLFRVSGTYGYFYNNSIIKCNTGFSNTGTSTEGAIILKNNLAQGNVTAAFVTAGAGWGTTAKNISEDATSPDAAYRSKDLHTNSVFYDYASDNYKINKNGDVTNLAIVDDGEDITAIFTDDVNNPATRRSVPIDIGASQRDPAGAGGLLTHPGMDGLGGRYFDNQMTGGLRA